jgi:hypothetical protein
MNDVPATWRTERIIINGGEPDNRAELYHRDYGDPEALELIGLVFEGRFRRGPCRCGLWRLGDGCIRWWMDEEAGEEPALRDALMRLPRLVTDPDREHDGEPERLALPVRCLAAQRGRAMVAEEE